MSRQTIEHKYTVCTFRCDATGQVRNVTVIGNANADESKLEEACAKAAEELGVKGEDLDLLDWHVESDYEECDD